NSPELHTPVKQRSDTKETMEVNASTAQNLSEFLKQDPDLVKQVQNLVQGTPKSIREGKLLLNAILSPNTKQKLRQFTPKDRGELDKTFVDTLQLAQEAHAQKLRNRKLSTPE